MGIQCHGFQTLRCKVEVSLVNFWHQLLAMFAKRAIENEHGYRRFQVVECVGFSCFIGQFKIDCKTPLGTKALPGQAFALRLFDGKKAPESREICDGT